MYYTHTLAHTQVYTERAEETLNHSDMHSVLRVARNFRVIPNWLSETSAKRLLTECVDGNGHKRFTSAVTYRHFIDFLSHVVVRCAQCVLTVQGKRKGGDFQALALSWEEREEWEMSGSVPNRILSLAIESLMGCFTGRAVNSALFQTPSVQPKRHSTRVNCESASSSSHSSSLRGDNGTPSYMQSTQASSLRQQSIRNDQMRAHARLNIVPRPPKRHALSEFPVRKLQLSPRSTGYKDALSSSSPSSSSRRASSSSHSSAPPLPEGGSSDAQAMAKVINILNTKVNRLYELHHKETERIRAQQQRLLDMQASASSSAVPSRAVSRRNSDSLRTKSATVDAATASGMAWLGMDGPESADTAGGAFPGCLHRW